MIARALLVASTLAAGGPIPREAWLAPQETFRTISGFRVRVDVHAQGEGAATLRDDAQQQLERSLRRRNVPVVEIPRGTAPSLDGTGALVLDVHVVEAGTQVSIAWSLHASQVVHLRTGAFAFAATWEVGDLVVAPAPQAREALRASLQPAIEEVCDHYLASRRPPSTEPAEPPAPSPEPDAGGVPL